MNKNTVSKYIFPPSISVIIPMYNVERYIKTCLDSVLNQTFKNFEIICVNDGCTDNTVSIVKTYADPRIRIINQANRGLAAARNTGINVSRGTFIALLDSDDFWRSDKLKQHFEHLCSDSTLGVSYSASSFVDDNNNVLGIGQYPQLRNIHPALILCRNPVGNGSSPVIRKLALTQIAFRQLINGEKRKSYFDETLRQSEDIELWVRLALNTGWRFEGIEDTLTFYRVNASGLSANLEKQYESWQFAMQKNRIGHEDFFKRWFSLANAYQKRYLSRRAIQSNNGFDAIRLSISALATNPRILIQEPFKTTTTLFCALLSSLPNGIYNRIQRASMHFLGKYRLA